MVTLRLVDAKLDVSQITSMYKTFVLNTPITFESVPPDELNMLERISKVTRRYPWLVCELDGDILGYAHGSPFRERKAYEWVVETSVYVKESFQGIGVGLGLYSSLINCLRKLQFSKAVGVIAIPNEPSRKLHRRIGYKHEATLSKIGWQHGAWQDVEVWTLQLNTLDPTISNLIKLNEPTKDNELEKEIVHGRDQAI